MTDRRTDTHETKKRVARRLGLAALAMTAALVSGGLLTPPPAFAWWRGGVWVQGPGYYPARPYYGPRPYYAPRPYYYAPPPVYVAPPVVVAPPPVYYPAPPVAYSGVARSCYTPNLSCPMEVARTPGTACYCSDALGNRSWGTAH
jgi:hypothetical protein